MDKLNAVLGAIPFVLLPYLFSGRSAEITFENLDWYNSLEQPVFSPPGYVFGPVWGVLYGLMGLSAYLVWLRTKPYYAAFPLAVFGGQLILNWSWSPTFFGAQDLTVSVIVIVATLIGTILTTIVFFPISKVAGALLIPYIIWLLYASAVNIAVLILNSDNSTQVAFN